MNAEIRDRFDDINTLCDARAQWLGRGRAEDFRETLVEVPGTGTLLCGIRHVGMDRERPFVSVTPTFSLVDAHAARQLYQQVLRPRFEVFAPCFIRLVVPGSICPLTAIGSQTWVASAADIPRPPTKVSVDLTEPSSNSYYTHYERLYHSFHTDHPQYQYLVSCNKHREMERYRSLGCLREVRVDQQPVGYIAADRTAFLGHPALYLTEIILDAAFRGQGLGQTIQRQFIGECARPKDYVWGTIESSNHAAIQTASANRRIPVQTESFVPLS